MLINYRLQRFIDLLGPNTGKTGHLEKWVSGAGGLAGILAILWSTQHFLDMNGAAWVVASMGASAVLLFAVPHAPLSQPWPVLGGHFFSAIIGVTCARWIPDQLVAAPLAVGVAIGVMYYLRCIHPPGGATALTAVMGSQGLHELGYHYVATPVMLNAVIILTIGFLFNFPFSWRRYPVALAARPEPQSHVEDEPTHEIDGLTREDIEKALEALNLTIDISARDLEEIYRLAQRNAHSGSLRQDEIAPGHYYSNGQYGAFWQVRQVIDMANPVKSGNDLVIYKIVAGNNRRKTGSMTIEQFALWARYEVYLNENSWQRASDSGELVQVGGIVS